MIRDTWPDCLFVLDSRHLSSGRVSKQAPLLVGSAAEAGRLCCRPKLADVEAPCGGPKTCPGAAHIQPPASSSSSVPGPIATAKIAPAGFSIHKCTVLSPAMTSTACDRSHLMSSGTQKISDWQYRRAMTLSWMTTHRVAIPVCKQAVGFIPFHALRGVFIHSFACASLL